MKTTAKGLTAVGLRYLAMLFMLLDHIWYTLVRPEMIWLTLVGRMALPIFAFQIAEGYFHTSNFKRYALRLLMFAIISEIPFNLMVSGRLIWLSGCNVMVTLLLGLLALKVTDWAAKQSMPGKIAGILAALCLYAAGDWLGTDYGSKGILLVLFFGFVGKLGRSNEMARKCNLDKVIQLIGLAGINFLISGRVWNGIGIQNFATLSLVFIWLYRGEKGTGGRLTQYFAYGFYPAHILLLAVLRQVL